MYEGFLRLGGTELVNASRTQAYVANLLPGFPLKNCQGAPELARALGETYNSPLQDGAPWVDPQNPATYGFYGLYPISVEGIDSSTVRATVTESLSDGGYVNSPRASSREIRVRGVLIGDDDLAIAAGQTWLNEALAQSNCEGPRDCSGVDLNYFAAPPQFEICYDTDMGGGDLFRQDGLVPGDIVSVGFNTLNRDARVIGQIIPVAGWDGLTFSWGVSRLIGSIENIYADPLFAYGPVTPYRTNYIRNPRFAVDTGLWGADAPLARVPAGGPDGGTFARLTLSAGLSHMQTEPTGALSGQNMLQFRARTGLPVFTVNVRSSVDFALLYSETFTGDSDWNEYSMVIPNGSQTLLEFELDSTGAATFDVSMVAMEAATQLFPYFDGSSVPQMVPSGYPDALSPEYATSWLGVPNLSPSRMMWVGGPLRYEYCGEGFYTWVSVSSGVGAIEASYGFTFPETDAQMLLPFQRYMRDVSRIDGPRVVRDFKASGGVGRVVEFLLVAGTPFAYMNTGDPIEWTLGLWPSVNFTDTAPPAPPPSVVVDPDCPPAPAPPRPPIIENSCVVTPGTWDRYVIPIPGERISRWSAILPRFTIQNTDEIRQLRVRSYQNPLGVRASRTNMAPRPYPVIGGDGWLSNSPSMFNVTFTTAGARRAGTVTSRTERTSVTPDSIIAALSNVGSSGNTPDPAKMILLPGATSARTMFSFYYRVFNAPNPVYRMFVRWYNAAGVMLNSSIQAPQATIGDSSSWHRATYLANMAPAGADRAVVQVEFSTASGGLVTGDEVVLMQDFQVEFEQVTPYFDGNGYRPVIEGQDDGDGNLAYAWTGTPFATPSTATIDPFGFESEFIVSYLPENSVLSVDSTVRRSEIYLPTTLPGVRENPISAANLIYGQDGGPMSWPEYRCAVPYIITVDLPPGTDPDIEVVIGLTRRE